MLLDFPRNRWPSVTNIKRHRTSLPFKTRGAIVNVGSLASHIGLNRITPYVMAKHGQYRGTRRVSSLMQAASNPWTL